jgi:hypothetical protein
VLFAGAVSLAASGRALAQQSLLGPGSAYISAGAASVSTSELDRRLTADGYPTFGQTARELGIGGYRVLANHVMLGAELTGAGLDEQPSQGREVGLGGGHATLGIGYMKQLSPRLRVYPRLGLGAGGLTLWVESADTVTFDSVLANPQPVSGRQRLLSRDGGVVDLGGGIEVLPGGGHVLLIGARAGYIISSFGSESNWQLQNGTATGGPSASLNGFYARVVLGAAWTR